MVLMVESAHVYNNLKLGGENYQCPLPHRAVSVVVASDAIFLGGSTVKVGGINHPPPLTQRVRTSCTGLMRRGALGQCRAMPAQGEVCESLMEHATRVYLVGVRSRGYV